MDCEAWCKVTWSWHHVHGSPARHLEVGQQHCEKGKPVDCSKIHWYGETNITGFSPGFRNNFFNDQFDYSFRIPI